MRFTLPSVAIFYATQTFKTVESFSSPSSALNDVAGIRGQTSLNAQASNPIMDFIASAMDPQQQQTKKDDLGQRRRELGSQELLMLPRQYSPNPDVTFPSLNHVSCAILSITPSESVLKKAINQVMGAHPLLQCKIQGDGEPEKRIDLFKMVRKGEPNPCTFVSKPGQFSADHVLKVVDVPGGSDDRAALDASWQESFNRDLDDGSWCEVDSSPLWKVELHRTKGPTNNKGQQQPCALLFSFNHAISDQSSASRLTDQIVSVMAEIEEKGRVLNRPVSQELSPSVEESVLGRGQRWADIQTGGVSLGTIKYVAGKAAEEIKSPVVLPDGVSTGGGVLGALTTISGNAAGGEDENSLERKSTLQFRSLSSEATSALLAKCREHGVSITNALSAAATLTSTDFVDNGKQSGKERNYKVLQSLDMRRFGEQLDTGETVGCSAGSMDLMHGPLPDRSGEKFRSNPNRVMLKTFWDLAKEGKDQTAAFIESDGPKHAVRVFDFAMTIADLNNLVYQTAQSKDSQGRAYSVGFTNAGVYERLDAFEKEGDGERKPIKAKYGKFEVEDVFFAASNARSGSLYRFSCITIGDEMKFTFHPAAPIVDAETNEKYADALLEMLEIVSGVKDVSVEESKNPLEYLPKNSLALAAAAVGSVALLSHAGAYFQFLQSVMQMKQNVENPADFWDALNFWVFFAVGHPILPPILWISDVLHGSPGPKVADLVPYTFLAGNVIFITAFTFSKEIKNAVNVAALFAFLTYVGAGLDGTAGLGDFNLALDDNYKGQVVKGCPAYEEVRQPTMDNFDLKKYQGLWYEQKFHDWTQFKEVYDTTLGIKLTSDGKGWIDDFAVKGPAPNSAPLSWDKSPVANGAHYFLFGRVDEKDPPGILREKGFGVEFPNYIVDVQKDTKTGEYTEAIQFQCLERGGVRVFEGINFMSRNPVMTETEMKAMHARAEQAGMYPYGASPEQMHTVAQRPIGAPVVDNTWQAMWRAIGVDKLLELLTESIEDGGR